MWKDNYDKYLFDGSFSVETMPFDECDRALRNIFVSVLLGSLTNEDSKKVFNEIKNTAIFEIKKSNKGTIDDILKKAENIGVSKNNDYGSDNILKFGIIGLVVRIGDKIARFQNLSKAGSKQSVNDEKIEDTLIDIVNYSVYGEMLSDGVWS